MRTARVNPLYMPENYKEDLPLRLAAMQLRLLSAGENTVRLTGENYIMDPTVLSRLEYEARELLKELYRNPAFPPGLYADNEIFMRRVEWDVRENTFAYIVPQYPGGRSVPMILRYLKGTVGSDAMGETEGDNWVLRYRIIVTAPTQETEA